MNWVRTSAVFLFLGLGACTAKVDGGSLPAAEAPEQKAFKDAVVGPSLDGDYKSDCVSDRWSRDHGFLVLEMKITGRQVTRIENTFTDIQCSAGQKVNVRSGLFRYVAQKGDGVYDVQYRFDFFSDENVRLDNGVLYVSDFVSGDATPDIALKPVTTATAAAK